MALDKYLVCKNCGKEFIFSASEQEFFASKGYTNDPTKCKDCRRLAKLEKEQRGSTAVCVNCGKTEKVTFTVTHPDTILCNDCFEKLRPHLMQTLPPEQTTTEGELQVVNLEDATGIGH